MKEVAAKIKSAREHARLSQAEVAHQLGLTPQGYAYFENGRRSIGLHYFLQLPAIFGVPITDILPAETVGKVDREKVADPDLAKISASWSQLPRWLRESVILLIQQWEGQERS